MSTPNFVPANLLSEYAPAPLGLERCHPRLSWELPANVRGQRQTAYQVQVASSKEALAAGEPDLWDSGRVESDASIQVPYGGRPLGSRMRCYWRVRIWDKDGQPSAFGGPAWFEMGLLEAGDWSAQWIDLDYTVSPGNEQPSPLLRKEFDLPAPVARARAYVSALGVYECYINGHRLGNGVLAPEWTDYVRRVQYQTYDVTEHLRTGINAAGAMLGYGWYAGRLGLAPRETPRCIYGDRPRFLMQIEVELVDGRRCTLVTDGTWQGTLTGPVVNSCLLDGETQDLRRALPGWDQPGYDVAGSPAAWQPVWCHTASSPALISQYNEPIRVMLELAPTAMTQPAPGVFVYDMAQNMVGWCRLMVRGEAGEVVRLRFAEALQDDGTIYTENLRSAKQIDTFTLAGGETMLEPHFTYHGFRYVEVTGLSAPPALTDLTGRVFYSGAPAAGTFTCSDPMVNRLMQNIIWTQRGNLHSSPTDCPQRDERAGWMGDAGLFSQAACFNMHMARFYTKWVLDIRDAQNAEGAFADISPNAFAPLGIFYGGPGWGDAGVIVPWRAYQNYGDKDLLAEHFAAARAWVDFVHRNNPDFIWRNRRGNDYGDWLNADTFVLRDWPAAGGQVPKEVYSTAFFAHSADLLSRMATVLGDEETCVRYRSLYEQIRDAFRREFVAPDGRMTGDTQAGYALALHFDLVPEHLRPAALGYMLEGIERYGGRLSTGIQSTNRMMLELAKMGRADVAYRLLMAREMPSWGYMIDQGATTIWERWDGFVAGRGFQNPGMNSFNHVAIGAVGEWLYRCVAGINPDDDQPAYKHIIIRPLPGGGLTHARAEYDSMYGKIVSAWRISDGEFRLQVVVPGNATATIYLPVAGTGAVTEGSVPIAQVDGIDILGVEAGRLAVKVGAGHYSFTMPA